MAEEKIQEGLKDGLFDNLPGSGKPQQFEDLTAVPKDLRVSYKVLKNAGYLPEEIQIRKDIVTLNDLIRCCDDDHELGRLNAQLRIKRLRFNQLAEKRSIQKTRAFRNYRDKIFNHLHM
ncbi:DnaJ family domain-containing protein [Sporolactobacillus pectinivorans]|uniref:DnaJ family domain-containing protein n=1 Tax=Sporolactobacillus pectinivorans TaxID=1591408 RepID=UPI001875025D|nr:DnaJ family domain-containing protein [Sporolactobacillus pectinivorans]